MIIYIRGFSHFVTSMTAPIASGWSKIAGWDFHPLENAAFARRTPKSEVQRMLLYVLNCKLPFRSRMPVGKPRPKVKAPYLGLSVLNAKIVILRQKIHLAA